LAIRHGHAEAVALDGNLARALRQFGPPSAASATLKSVGGLADRAIRRFRR
jgi:hypothetical protein